MKKNRERNFFTGALMLSLGGLLAKILGALYRIPLTNIIGSYGMGLYQLVFPPYILMLCLSQAGVPTAISKLVAEKNQLDEPEKSKKIFTYCFKLLSLLGIAGAVAMALLSGVIARAQGNTDTTTAFLIVAPALIFVPVTNVLKGYFQGNMNMTPSSVTTVIEQVVKLIVGLVAAISFMPDVKKAVYGAVLAITVSEFASLVIMSVVYFVYTKKNKEKGFVRLEKADYGQITRETMSLAVPVALGGFVMQMSQVIDSVMVVNLLTVPNATSMYGLWTGPVNSMLGLPIALSAGVSVSALPSITKAFVSGDGKCLSKGFNSALKLTTVIALPSALGMIVLSRPIISLLYGSLPNAEITVSAVLLSLSGMSILFLSVMQTFVSVLQAVGKPYVSVIVLAVGIVVKAVVNLILLPIPKVNIYGAAASETLCYLFATVCVIIYLSAKLKLKMDVTGCVMKPLAASFVMTLGLTVMYTFAESFVSTKLGTLIAIFAAALLYFATLLGLKVFEKNEFQFLPTKE